MSGFKDMVEADINKVFINTSEFAEAYTVIYDGVTYENIPIVLSGISEKDRHQLVSDHVQGLFLATTEMYVAASDLGGVVPKKGTKIRIIDGDTCRTFYVGSSINEMGVIRLELEVLDE